MKEPSFENLYHTILTKEMPINEVIGVLNNTTFIWNMSLDKWVQLIKKFDETKKLESLITHIAQAICNKKWEIEDNVISFVIELVISDSGYLRILGRKLWDRFIKEFTEIENLQLSTNKQIKLIFSLTQDLQSPETRIPFLLNFFNSPSKEIRDALNNALIDYIFNYFGLIKDMVHNCTVVKSDEFNALVLFIKFLDNRFNLFTRCKEFHSEYCFPKEYEIIKRISRERIQKELNEKYNELHSPLWQFFNKITLGRGGGMWNNGINNPLKTIKVEKPIPMMLASMTPLEEILYTESLFNNWSNLKEDEQ